MWYYENCNIDVFVILIPLLVQISSLTIKDINCGCFIIHKRQTIIICFLLLVLIVSNVHLNLRKPHQNALSNICGARFFFFFFLFLLLFSCLIVFDHKLK